MAKSHDVSSALEKFGFVGVSVRKRNEDLRLEVTAAHKKRNFQVVVFAPKKPRHYRKELRLNKRHIFLKVISGSMTAEHVVTSLGGVIQILQTVAKGQYRLAA